MLRPRSFQKVGASPQVPSIGMMPLATIAVAVLVATGIALSVSLPAAFPTARLHTMNTTTTTTTSAPTTPPPAIPTFTCPDTQFVQTPTITDTGICIAYNSNDGGLYYWNGANEFRRLNIDDYPTTVPVGEGPNLASPGGIVSGADYIDGCAYDPVSGEFFVSKNGQLGRHSLSNTYTLLSNTGYDAYYIGRTGDGRLFGLTDGGGEYPSERFTLQEYNSSTGATIGSEMHINLDIVPTGVYVLGVGMAWDPFTQRMYVAFRTRSIENPSTISASGAWIARVDTSFMGIAQATCITSLPSTVTNIAFDSTGRLWTATSGTGGDKKKRTTVAVDWSIYVTSDGVGPMPTQMAGGFDLTCESSTVDHNIEALPIPSVGYDIGGLGCNGETIARVLVNYLPGTVGLPLLLEDRTIQETGDHIVMAYHTTVMTGGEANFTNMHIMPNNLTFSGNVPKKRAIASHPLWFSRRLQSYNDVIGSSGPTPRDQYSGGVASPGLESWQMVMNPDAGPYPMLVSYTEEESVDLSIVPTVNCQTVQWPVQIVGRYDSVADRFVYAYVGNVGNVLCILVSDTSSALGAWSAFEFSLGAAVDAKRMDFAIWGNHYLTCYDDDAASGGVPGVHSNCLALERDRIINGGGTPRMVTLPKHSIVAFEASAATASLLNQEPNNGGPGAFETAFPGGVIITMAPGKMGMVAVSMIDYASMAVTSMESTTVIGTWNDGTSGSCENARACVPLPGGGVSKDPLRWEPGVAYRYFPSTGETRMVAGITVDADGTDYAKVRWGEFILNSNGTASLLGDGMQIFQHQLTVPGTPRHTFAPAYAYTPSGILVCTYLMAGADDELGFYMAYRYLSTPAGEWTFNSLLTQIHGERIGNTFESSTSFTPRHKPDIYPGEKSIFGLGWIQHTGLASNKITRLGVEIFNATEQYIAQKVFTRDECNYTATCVGFITLAPPDLPPHINGAKKRGMLRGG